VFRVTVAGKTILFTGDGSIVTEYMLKRYHNANASDSSKYYNLKSDIVQVSHHGVQAMGREVYNLINPHIALWCSPYHDYAARPGDKHTTYYIRKWFEGPLATTNFIAYDGVDVLSFPVQRASAAVSIPADIKPLVFEAQYYANRYPDLKAAYGTDETKLYNHFINYGIEEGRCASPLFDVKFYMNHNSQNFQETMKGNYDKAFKHFLSNCNTTTLMRLSPLFDASVYAASHSNLTTGLALLKHFAANGYLKGEVATKLYASKEGHTYHTKCTVTQPKAPECGVNGNTLGIKCSACNTTLVASQSVAAQPHTYVASENLPLCTPAEIPTGAFFANFTGKSNRYTTDALYSGVNYDSASNWSYLSARYTAPTVNSAEGTLTAGFANTNYNHIWIQTGPDYSYGFNMKYKPGADHIVQMRV